jgi:hypothetical protein
MSFLIVAALPSRLSRYRRRLPRAWAKAAQNVLTARIPDFDAQSMTSVGPTDHDPAATGVNSLRSKSVHLPHIAD